MKKVTLVFISSLISIITILGQASTDYAVQCWADISEDQNSITINWSPVNGANAYQVFRKGVNSSNWGSPLAMLPDTTTSYVDTNVDINTLYDYKVEKTGNVNGFGYIHSGIHIEPNHFKGNLLLLIDDSFSTPLENEINQLIDDMIGDGWHVITRYIARDETAINVKEEVLDIYYSEPNNLEAVFSLGHVPVPYSGDFAPDGHTNNHDGAWPCDGYYGDMNGNWTDQVANKTTASQPRNHNIPGDGKFDQVYFPSAIELQVGRVDFANMPAFTDSEEDLLRKYLQKNHAYKTGQIKTNMQAVIDDNFGGFGGEAFASSAWKSIGPLVDPVNVSNGDYRMSMDTSSYVWSYGCGAGSYTSCSGVGNTNQIAGDSLQGIFTCLFGSYFGDWDAQNNLMRASLGQGTILTNCWNGRPHWIFHHMGLGQNIGYSARLSMNNNGITYNTPLTFLGNIVSMGLMGDPTLKMYIVPPVRQLTESTTSDAVELNWSRSEDTTASYFIYKSLGDKNNFQLINETATLENTFIDICPEPNDTIYYMVRSSRLEVTPSGSFHNLSTGVIT
ncbi:MAG: fibronectin type III domain-containing protein, partial [Bacteroidia bacterium]|nr:fibronectin type III domain-containing protein [Bacteroidia bacterium]